MWAPNPWFTVYSVFAIWSLDNDGSSVKILRKNRSYKYYISSSTSHKKTPSLRDFKKILPYTFDFDKNLYKC